MSQFRIVTFLFFINGLASSNVLFGSDVNGYQSLHELRDIITIPPLISDLGLNVYQVKTIPGYQQVVIEPETIQFLSIPTKDWTYCGWYSLGQRESMLETPVLALNWTTDNGITLYYRELTVSSSYPEVGALLFWHCLSSSSSPHVGIIKAILLRQPYENLSEKLKNLVRRELHLSIYK